MRSMSIKSSFIAVICLAAGTLGAGTSYDEWVSPCPRLFAYDVANNTRGTWYGIVVLLSDTDVSGVWLKIVLDQPSLFLGNYFGEVVVREGNVYMIKNRDFKLKAYTPKVINFFVNYDPEGDTPHLVRLLLNAKTICPEDATTIEESRKKPYLFTSDNVSTLSANSSNHSSIEPPKHIAPSTSSTLAKGPEVYNRTCGKRLSVQATHMVLDGHNSSKGHWPWHIAIMKLDNIAYNYHCGGTLISAKSVLTPAHCVTILPTIELIDKGMLILYLGTTNLSDQGPYFKVRLLQNIIVHNEYNPAKFHNDLAIVDMEPVEFSDYLRPICLWEGDLEINSLVGKYGTVVSWGLNSSNQIAADLMEGQTPFVSLGTCLYHDPRFFGLYTSPKTFCAGGPDGTAVCNVTSGGSMAFPRKASMENDQIWYLRGVISVTPIPSKSDCNTKNYIVLSNVTQHLVWIKKTAGIS